MIPILALLACAPIAVPPQTSGFSRLDLPLNGSPERVLVSNLDPGPTADVTVLVNRGVGVYDLTTLGLTASGIQVEVLPGLAQLGYIEQSTMAEADFTGDGVPDLGLSPLYATQSYVGNGDLTHRPGPFLPTYGGSQHAVGFTDVDGDGDLDSVLLVRDFSSWYLDYGFNDGTGSFAEGSFVEPPGLPDFGSRLLFADIEGQGRDSTFVTGSAGLFRSHWPAGPNDDVLLLAGDFAEVAAADLDGVFGLDLVVCGRGMNAIAVLLEDGAGGFGPPTVLPAGAFPESVAIADLDGDGDQDLAVANRDGDSVTLFCGDGAGGFVKCVTYPVGRRPTDIAAGDVDGNGKVDLVVTCATSGVLSILLAF
ncbi:FG-GAP repeat domain-containing protein [Engelhardtia mirabilis]|uniref:FG-GAP repeat protein n=1 Tax=Engelhardtia mirabilis TaxID=2528011 RepID=A0A518BS22_9BACT|nr:FG-GAP repeat protein [Planctomycetes bacterium Pla133]QDV04100.1 FG-GAP repeat protein [Planctomycetes bacterium Pla86]